MLFAEIAVDTYQDPTKRLFTYEVPEKLAGQIKLGDLVEVPFGKRTVEGFVYQLTSKKPAVKTKPITKIKKEQILTLNQIKLTHWMSSYYAAPPLDCLKCQLPGKGERYTEGKNREIKTLLLVPYAVQVKLRALELSHPERKTTLVGSRSAVFTPLPNLEKIVIEEPENWIYKDERSPYYHAKNVAQKRAELEGLKLELKYLIPRVEDLALRKLRKEPLAISHKPLAAKVEIINLKKEREAGNFSPLSSEVVEAFRQTKRALAYVHSREVKKEVEKAIRVESLDVNRIEIAGVEIFTQVGKAFDVIALIDTDTLLNLPDFRAHEKLLLTVAKLSRLTLQRRASKQILVQTANPDFPLFNELKTGNLKDFYQRELTARKPLLYPPFGVLAKLEFSAKTTTKVNFEAEKLYEKLLAMSHEPLAISISPPYPPYSKTRGKAQLNIAIKAKTPHFEAEPRKARSKATPLRPHSAKASRGSEGQAHRELEKILASVPPSWKVIVDPESLL